MCGIMGYIGQKESYPIVIDGLKKMEYRGYDSAGIAIMNGQLNLYKSKGKVSKLEDLISTEKKNGHLAIGHTRWATHGIANDTNAHPHKSQSGNLVMVHNGIIENYNSLKTFLSTKGFTFKSQTDSEVFIQYIEWYKQTFNLSLKEAVRRAAGDIKGSFAIAIFDITQPNSLILAKKDNPLVIGLAECGFYIASDAGPLKKYTNKIIYVQDNQIAHLEKEGDFRFFDFEGRSVNPQIKTISQDKEEYCKNGYAHFMLKEIYQQPLILEQMIKSRIGLNGNLCFPELNKLEKTINRTSRIIIVACGTSWNAGLIGEYYLESLSRIPVEVEYASEFRYRNPIINKNDIVIGISQSGETADTLAAIKLANEAGALTYSIVNTKGSTIARHSNTVSYLEAGIEIGVASTKAFTSQVALLYLLSLKVAQVRGSLNKKEVSAHINEFKLIPEAISKILDSSEFIKGVSKNLCSHNNALFLGRGLNYPIALEGALKLKEISYIHAEGYPAAEMKHGPIALIDKNMPSIVIATNEDTLDKLISNLEEIKSRNAKVILIKNESLELQKDKADDIISIPYINDQISPILSAVPLQLLSYYAALHRDCNIDQPRNLAKSVTVE